MITFLVISLIILAIITIAVLTLGIGSAAILVVFGDIIVALGLIYYVSRRITKHLKKWGCPARGVLFNSRNIQTLLWEMKFFIIFGGN